MSASEECDESGNPWAEGIAEQVRWHIANGYIWGGLVLAQHFARTIRTSPDQARHILNRAAEYGAVEKVRLSTAGLDPKSAGAQFGYRPPRQPSSGPDAS